MPTEKGTLWRFHVKNNEFLAISEGKKTVDVRPWSNAMQHDTMHPGDAIIYFDADSKENKVVAVKYIVWYRTIRECLEQQKVEQCFPWITSTNEGVDYFLDILRQNKDIETMIQILKKGVFGIRIEIDPKKF